jgi:hypothetical protein
MSQPDKSVECPGGRAGAFGRSIDGLLILSYLDMPGGNDRALRIPRSADTIARLTGLSRATVCDQLVRLRRHGYVEETTGQRYRLPIGGRQPGIVVTCTRGLQSLPRDTNQGDDTASASA